MRPEDPLSYQHGDSSYRRIAELGVCEEEVINLAVNLNPFAPPCEGVLRGLVERGVHLRYPDERSATRVVAERLEVAPERVVLTNGGSEAIALVARVNPCGWFEEPEFALYRRYLGSVKREGLLWRSNPRNPTGELAGSGERADVWDESFYPHSTGSWSRGAREGAWVVGSLTKLLSVPGLRIGYVVAPDEASAARIRLLKPQWSVNALALGVVEALVEGLDLQEQARKIREARSATMEVFLSAGFQVLPSDAPYFLLSMEAKTYARLEARGVLLRDCSNFGLPGLWRARVAGEAELERLARALSAL